MAGREDDIKLALYQSDQLAMIARAMKLLASDRRAVVLRLRTDHGMSLTQIGEALGLSYSRVSQVMRDPSRSQLTL